MTSALTLRGDGREPWRDDATELALISAAVADPRLLPVALADVRADDFGDPVCALLWECVQSLASERRFVTPRALSDILSRRGRLQTVAAVVDLDTLLHGPLGGDAFREVVSIVSRNGRGRRTWRACRRLAMPPECEPDVYAGNAIATIAEAAQRSTRTRGKSALDVALEYVADIERRANDQTGMLGLSTGFPDVDRWTSGLNSGSLVVLAGRPGMGKTAFAGALSRAVAEQGRHVAFFSLEMPTLELWERVVCSDARIDSREMATATPTAAMVGGILESTARLSRLSVTFWDDSGLSVDDMRAALLGLQAPEPLGLVVIDHLGLVRPPPHTRGMRPDLQIGAVSLACKALAKELGVTVLLLSQLNREVEKMPDKRPLLSHLRESGEIEQNADQVWFLFREHYYRRTRKGRGADESVDPMAADLTIAKVRGRGQRKRVAIRFDERFTRFDSAETDPRRDGTAPPDTNWQDGGTDE